MVRVDYGKILSAREIKVISETDLWISHFDENPPRTYAK